jgi:hypothetical protein
VTLLQHSAGARKIFLFQAALYSWFVSNDLPDGILGPKTHRLALLVNQVVNPGTRNDTLDDDTLRAVRATLDRLASGIQPRLLATVLPRSLVDQINAEGQATHVPVLQIAPT